MARPRLVAFHQSDVIVGQVVIDGADYRPVDGGGDFAARIVAVDVAGHLIEGQFFIKMAFTVPKRFSERHGVCRGIPAPSGTVGSDDVDGVVERRILPHLRSDGPQAVFRPVVGSYDLDGTEAVGAERRLEILIPLNVVALLISSPHIVDGQMVVGLRMFEPPDHVGDHVRGPIVSVANPVRGAPGQGGQLDLRISGFGLFHQPPLITAVIVFVRSRVHVARLRTVGGVHVGANFHLEDLQAGPIVRLEQIVENLAAIGLGVVDQEPGVPASAADSADAIEDSPGAGGVDGNGLPHRNGRGENKK